MVQTADFMLVIAYLLDLKKSLEKLLLVILLKFLSRCFFLKDELLNKSSQLFVISLFLMNTATTLLQLNQILHRLIKNLSFKGNDPLSFFNIVESFHLHGLYLHDNGLDAFFETCDLLHLLLPQELLVMHFKILTILLL